MADINKNFIHQVKNNIDDFDEIEHLLTHGADPNIIINGEYLLNYVIKKNKLELACLLIKYDADVTKEDKKGYTSLELSFGKKDNEELLSLIMEIYPDINRIVPQIGTTLRYAVMLMDLTAVEILLDNGADIYLGNGYSGAYVELLHGMYDHYKDECPQDPSCIDCEKYIRMYCMFDEVGVNTSELDSSDYLVCQDVYEPILGFVISNYSKHIKNFRKQEKKIRKLEQELSFYKQQIELYPESNAIKELAKEFKKKSWHKLVL